MHIKKYIFTCINKSDEGKRSKRGWYIDVFDFTKLNEVVLKVSSSRCFIYIAHKHLWWDWWLPLIKSNTLKAWNKSIKAIGGVNHIFYKLILFYRVFTEFQVAFYRFQKFKLVFEIKQVKVRDYNRFLIGGAN